MSQDFPPHSEIGESNVRAYLRREREYRDADDDLQYVRVSMREER